MMQNLIFKISCWLYLTQELMTALVMSVADQWHARKLLEGRPEIWEAYTQALPTHLWDSFATTMKLTLTNPIPLVMTATHVIIGIALLRRVGWSKMAALLAILLFAPLWIFTLQSKLETGLMHLLIDGALFILLSIQQEQDLSQRSP